MNTRTRQKIKAELRRENPDVMATIRDEGPWRQILFVPRSEIRVYKQRYGDNIKFWDEKEERQWK